PTTPYAPAPPTQAAGRGTSAVSVSANISGLTPGSPVHYRLVASNGSGTTNGSDASFATPSSSTGGGGGGGGGTGGTGGTGGSTGSGGSTTTSTTTTTAASSNSTPSRTRVLPGPSP